MKRPSTCLDLKCETVTSLCMACLNRSILAKKGYELIQAIEMCGASAELIKAVNLAEAFIKLAEKEIDKNI